MCSTNMAVNDRLVAFEFTTFVDCTVQYVYTLRNKLLRAGPPAP